MTKIPPREQAVLKAVAKVLRPILQRLDALERQAQELKYTGSWQPDREYRPGNFATHGGSVWHANAITCDRPGTSAAWTLACKRGASAKANGQ